LPIICVPICMAAFASTVGDNIIALTESLTAYNDSRVNTALTYVAHGSDLTLDTVITVAMCILLSRERKSSFQRTNSMINRLFVLTINTGLTTASCTLLLIIFLSVQKNVLTYVFFNYIIAPLYMNSALANLNSRDYIRGAGAITYSSGSNLDNHVELGSLRITSNKRSNNSRSRSDTLDVGTGAYSSDTISKGVEINHSVTTF